MFPRLLLGKVAFVFSGRVVLVPCGNIVSAIRLCYWLYLRCGPDNQDFVARVSYPTNLQKWVSTHLRTWLDSNKQQRHKSLSVYTLKLIWTWASTLSKKRHKTHPRTTHAITQRRMHRACQYEASATSCRQAHTNSQGIVAR